MAIFPAPLPIPLKIIIALHNEHLRTASKLTMAVGAILNLIKVQTFVATKTLRVRVIKVVIVTRYRKQTDKKTIMVVRKITSVTRVRSATLLFYAGFMPWSETRLVLIE